jgi:hypothetical protein
MALYLSSDISGGGSSGGGGGSGDISYLIRSSTSWYFHALRRDAEGMLYYNTLRPTDDGVIDVFNEENSQLSDLLDGIDNVDSKSPVLGLKLLAGGTKVSSEANQSYNISGLLSNKTGKNLVLTITRDSEGVISDIVINDGGEDFGVGDEILVSSTDINEEVSQSDLHLQVTELVKTYSNSPSDKYQQYRFDARKISYYIDDQGYLVAKFGNHDYSQAPR